MQNLTPLLALLAAVLFLIAGYLTPDRDGKIAAVGMALLALAIWVR